MGFRLPMIQELSIEQDAINNLPLSGTHVVTGPPGTGKTVLGIYRCMMFHRQGVLSTFIVYNNVLNWYLDQSIRTAAPGSTASTFDSFIWGWYKENFRTAPPFLPPIPGTRYKPHDWNAIKQQVVMSGGKFRKIPHLVLDEAQDFHPAVFPLLPLITDSVTVFADENQRLTSTNSNIGQIRSALGIGKTHPLKVNYRNTRPIAQFAKDFYVGTQTGIPDLPERAGTKPMLVTVSDVEAQARLILQYERNYPQREIGVLVHRNKHQEWLQRVWRGKTVNPVQNYVSGFGNGEASERINFGAPGIRLINFQSAKGLEFDAVFIPFIDKWEAGEESVSTRMTMYVMASRARNDLRMLQASEGTPAILKGVSPELYDRRTVSV